MHHHYQSPAILMHLVFLTKLVPHFMHLLCCDSRTLLIVAVEITVNPISSYTEEKTSLFISPVSIPFAYRISNCSLYNQISVGFVIPCVTVQLSTTFCPGQIDPFAGGKIETRVTSVCAADVSIKTNNIAALK